MVSTKNPVINHDVTITLPFDKSNYTPPPTEEISKLEEILDGWFKVHSKNFVFQLEQGKNEHNLHFQCRLRLKKKIRCQQLSKELGQHLDEHVEIQEMMKRAKKKGGMSSWVRSSPTSNACRNFKYVMKEESRISGPWSDRHLSDLELSDTVEVDRLYHWQKYIYDKVLTKGHRNEYNSDGRKIIFLVDPHGCAGKSELVRTLMTQRNDVQYVPSCGTASQFKNGIAEAGAFRNYVLDLPRVKPKMEQLSDLASTLEDISNGFVSGVMYGKVKHLIMNRPNIVVSGNWFFPRELLSRDRFIYMDPGQWRDFELEHGRDADFRVSVKTMDNGRKWLTLSLNGEYTQPVQEISNDRMSCTSVSADRSDPSIKDTNEFRDAWKEHQDELEYVDESDRIAYVRR